MARLRPFLIQFFAALLFLQSGMAAAHCLRGMAVSEEMLVEICSADGMRTIRLDADGEPAPDAPPASASGFCPACHGLPDIILPEPPILAVPAWSGESTTWHAAGTPRLRAPGRAPPYAMRAPPLTA